MERTTVVITGATGDLTRRKLVPALFSLHCKGRLPQGLRIVGFSRSEHSDDAFRDLLWKGAEELADLGARREEWAEFAQSIHYVAGSVDSPSDFARLGSRLDEMEGAATPANRLFYLSVAPGLYDAAIEALGAGHHVLCEKPMALNVEQADRMIDAANRAGRRLMIAQCIRFWPEYRFLSRCVREGTYGKLLSLNMYRMGGRPIWSWENWFVDPARSGGPLYDLHIHDVDYVNSLLGLPEVVHATARMSEATGTYDVVHALYSYDGGPQVHIHAGWSTVQIPFQAGFDAWFERGFLRFDGKSDPPLQVYDDLEHARARPAEYEKGDAYYNEIAYFVDCVEKNAYPEECPPESARDSLGLVTREIAAIEWKGMRR